MKHKPKKGVMPAALKKYWAKRRRGKSSAKIVRKRKRTSHHYVNGKRVSREHYEGRKMNPSSTKRAARYILKIAKGNSTLYYVGGKFATSGAPVLFPNPKSLLDTAKEIRNRHSMLKSYRFFAQTVN